MHSDAKKRILIVDDERLNIDILTIFLEPDYTIIGALNGRQALEAAHSDPPPNLILLDVTMPEMDGYEICHRLKANQDTADIPVIFVTALDQEQDETLGFEVGAVDYIAKPIVPEIVKARIRIHLALQESLSELKEHQKIIESRNAELDEMNQLKNKFIGMAAHDLRNPIVSILGFADVLQSEEQLNTEDSRRYLGIISAACNKMLNLISDTLDVSVIESGELVLNLGIGSLADLVNERVQIFEPIAMKKNIEIVKQYSNVEDSWFDPSRVAQILDNLISNAIKFSPHDTKVFVTLEEVGDLLMISIKDQGPGISSEDQLKMFDHFQKLQNKPTDGETSTGLGLAIVKKIVDVHQGTLMVESEPGRGATFSFALPKENIQI
ncbi:MAG: hybrid sensor histidine kinase/response regulator [Gammaproteobacteria bacterium]|nr:hybrid sensor histidine kinase/response regulator [Gammaproteobacteria bacterium]